MNRKLIYTFTLIAFFIMWGVFGFAAAAPRSESSIQPALSSTETTSVVSDEAMIPVTGNQQPGWRILLVYGLIGLATLTLILSLLNAANKSTALYVQRKEHLAEETHKK